VVTAIKLVLTSVLLVIATYQVVLMLVCYRKIRPPFLSSDAAGKAHRAIGDTAVPIAVLVAVLCLTGYGIRDAIEHGGTRVALHVVAASALLIALAVKVVAVRVGGRMSRLLPVLGGTVFVLFALTFASTVPFFLGG
jgi:hypothetical protein